jgi:alpha-beta hydrolase superfamily lysophospholipase
MPINLAGKIAAAKIPVLLLYGGQDQTVDPKLNCEVFLKNFKQAGGNITVDKRWAYGHHPHGVELDETGRILKFFE